MANNIYMANEPIVQTVTLPGKVDGATLPEAVVHLRRTGDITSDPDYEFPMGAMWNETVSIDIAQAFISELARKGFLNPITQHFGGDADHDSATLYINTFTRYLKDGESVSTAYGSTESITAWRGGRSDSEIFFEKTITPGWPTSTKPIGDKYGNDWETVKVGEEIRLGNSFATPSSEGKVTINSTSNHLYGRHIYAEDTPLRRTFLFENHFGFIESASCLMMESKSYKINSENRSRTYPPGRSGSTLFTKKTGNRGAWKMSSGPVSRAWAEWFATEFLMSQSHWLKIQDRWLPVSITPDAETVTTYDESKGELISVEFTVTSGIKGYLPEI